jgi:cellulose synthase/poly-beta-1,6-N-acetylglucosamine synthase-like glycosyltransferase
MNIELNVLDTSSKSPYWWPGKSLLHLIFDLFLSFRVPKAIHAYQDRIFSPLTSLIKMLLTALCFILFTFTNGEEGKVSSKKTLVFTLISITIATRGVLYSIPSESEVFLMEMEASRRLVAHVK